MEATRPPRRRARTLAAELVDTLAERVRSGEIAVGERLPTEVAIMDAFGVSRTVVREALSRLQASGLVETRHGIGTFVLAQANTPVEGLRIAPEQAATLRDVISMLELRIGVEVEAAGLAAMRRTEQNLRTMVAEQENLARYIDDDQDAVAADRRFHLEIARASQNRHFVGLMEQLGAMLIPRTRLNTAQLAGENRRDYLLRVLAEHDSIVVAITHQDPEAARAAMRTHLSNSRERLRRIEAAAAEARQLV